PKPAILASDGMAAEVPPLSQPTKTAANAIAEKVSMIRLHVRLPTLFLFFVFMVLISVS
ncbi:MAG: hypothetical protein RLY69_1074, partial [Verrucomicrobiota bacterium]